MDGGDLRSSWCRRDVFQASLLLGCLRMAACESVRPAGLRLQAHLVSEVWTWGFRGQLLNGARRGGR